MDSIAVQRVHAFSKAVKAQKRVDKECGGSTEAVNIGTKKDPVLGFPPKAGERKECSQAKTAYVNDTSIPMYYLLKKLNPPPNTKKLNFEN